MLKLSLTVLLATMVVTGSWAKPAGTGGMGYHMVESIPGADGFWDYASVDPSAHRLYVARADGVMAVDLQTGAITARLVPGNRGHGVIPIPGSDLVLATNGADNTALIFHGGNGSVVATLQTGKSPDAAVYDMATRTVWVMNAKSGDATVIDPVSAKVVATLAIGGSLEFAAVDGRGRLFVNVEDQDAIAVVDTRARRLIGKHKLVGCKEPSGLAYADDAHVLISVCSNKVAKAISPEGHDIATLHVGSHPDAVIYDAGRHLAFVPAGGDGVLDVIRVSGPTRVAVVGHIQTKAGARTGALDPNTGRLYLPTSKLGPPDHPGGYPSLIPGTFEILVVAP